MPASSFDMFTRSFDEPATPSRPPRTHHRNLVPADRCEEIRKHIGMTPQNFSLAFGYKTDGAYPEALKTGTIVKVTENAAEWLLRQYVPDTNTYRYIVTVVQGIPTIEKVDGEFKEMTFEGVTYMLVPKGEQHA